MFLMFSSEGGLILGQTESQGPSWIPSVQGTGRAHRSETGSTTSSHSASPEYQEHISRAAPVKTRWPRESPVPVVYL